MNIRNWIALAAAFALWCGAAQGALKNVENAYETDAGHVSLPSGPTGEVVIHPCTTCKTAVLRVNAETRYLVGASTPPVSLEAFRQAMAAKGADKRLVVVFYNLDSLIVTRIILSAAR